MTLPKPYFRYDAVTMQLSGTCPRPYCRGAIMDGRCELCGRSLDSPPELLPIVTSHQGQGGGRPRKHEVAADPEKLSVKCRRGYCKGCGGQRMVGPRFVPCECLCHRDLFRAFPRWVSLKRMDWSPQAHLLLSGVLVGDPGIHWEVSCGRWLSRLDVVNARDGQSRCKMCVRKLG